MRRAWFVGVAGLAIMTASAGCSSDDGAKAQHTSLPGLTPKRLAALRASHVALDLHDAERQLAITDTEMFLTAGNARPGAYRISRATPVKAGLWRVEVTAGAGGRRQYSCFTIRLNRFYVHTTATDNVSTRGIETRNRGCP